MSLILDALNKSDQERADERPVPGLQSRHGPEPDSDSRRWNLPWVFTVTSMPASARFCWTMAARSGISCRSLVSNVTVTFSTPASASSALARSGSPSVSPANRF